MHKPVVANGFPGESRDLIASKRTLAIMGDTLLPIIRNECQTVEWKAVTVGETLKPRSLPDRYDTRKLRMYWTNGLMRSSIGTRSGPKGRALTAPGQPWVSANRVN